MYYPSGSRYGWHPHASRLTYVGPRQTRSKLSRNTMLSLNSMLGVVNPQENENTTLMNAYKECSDKLALLGDADWLEMYSTTVGWLM